MRQVLTTFPEARSAWLSALFVLVYVGVEYVLISCLQICFQPPCCQSPRYIYWILINNRVSLGGWVVEFLLRERNGAPFASGMVATGYWLGITAGRGMLPFVTNVLGIKVAITVRHQ